jgi:hypothetical protein
MSDLETRLTAALHADTPPARDVRFRVDALVRLEQARFRRRLGTIVLAATGLLVLAAASAPALDVWITDARSVWLVSLGALVALLGALLGRSSGVRTVAGFFGRWLYS